MDFYISYINFRSIRLRNRFVKKRIAILGLFNAILNHPTIRASLWPMLQLRHITKYEKIKQIHSSIEKVTDFYFDTKFSILIYILQLYVKL